MPRARRCITRSASASAPTPSPPSAHRAASPTLRRSPSGPVTSRNSPCCSSSRCTTRRWNSGSRISPRRPASTRPPPALRSRLCMTCNRTSPGTPSVTTASSRRPRSPAGSSSTRRWATPSATAWPASRTTSAASIPTGKPTGSPGPPKEPTSTPRSPGITCTSSIRRRPAVSGMSGSSTRDRRSGWRSTSICWNGGPRPGSRQVSRRASRERPP